MRTPFTRRLPSIAPSGLEFTALARADGSAAAVRTSDPVALQFSVLNEEDGASAIGATSSITLATTNGVPASDCQGEVSSICTASDDNVLRAEPLSVTFSDGKSSASTRNGRITVRFVVVGRDVATISTTSGMASGVEVVDTRTVGTTAAEAESPPARLSSTAPNGFSSWSRAADADAATTAADLLAELDGVSFIWLWNGSRWLYYGESDGAPIPGSLNFNIIGVTEVLYLVGGG